MVIRGMLWITLTTASLVTPLALPASRCSRQGICFASNSTDNLVRNSGPLYLTASQRMDVRLGHLCRKSMKNATLPTPRVSTPRCLRLCNSPCGRTTFKSDS
ncbi:MAG: hypothetical protein J3Q66DRAFT_331286 [Benniella sp.]|nr:MAG: hypothetical protein J3Q66DRAFT_331286 [Benniella sp.]